MPPEQGPGPEVKETFSFPAGDYQVIIYLPDKYNHYGVVGRRSVTLDSETSRDKVEEQALAILRTEMGERRAKDNSFEPSKLAEAQVVFYKNDERGEVNEQFVFRYSQDTHNDTTNT